MSKKVLIISSTPRRGGNSDFLCDRFAEGAREAGNDVEKIELRTKKIEYCQGCGACFNQHKPCPIKDDVSEIVDKTIAADVVVLATPVYFYTGCAQLKALIDRFCARYEEVVGKEFYLIATAADGAKRSMERTFDGLRGFLACLPGAKEKGAIYGVGAWQIGAVQSTPAAKEAFEMGKRV